MNDFNQLLFTSVYGFIAVAGGVARYLTGYVHGRRFRFSILCASSVISGFSGWTFALLGQSLNMPQPLTYVMAGVGGFFGEQTMKFTLEFIQKKL